MAPIVQKPASLQPWLNTDSEPDKRKMAMLSKVDFRMRFKSGTKALGIKVDLGVDKLVNASSMMKCFDFILTSGVEVSGIRDLSQG